MVVMLLRLRELELVGSRPISAEELTLAEHTRIVDAIAAGDGDAAAEAMRVHLVRANELYRRLGQQ